MFGQSNMPGDPNKGDVGVDRVEGEEGEMNTLYERVCRIWISEGVE